MNVLVTITNQYVLKVNDPYGLDDKATVNIIKHNIQNGFIEVDELSHLNSNLEVTTTDETTTTSVNLECIGYVSESL